ncbi:hypothetical protein J3R30DRAFT_3731187 [Lentinula aciculospora]|uniref:Uncharacterized protein n=1 Tax=Lentinula aciculospora TaxID=153920 RepID=A0A9W9DUQ9_9AGAR|nr:hypothetical protein J3R30DRAFT_3731187 [Lentinula aciculospora]
MVHQCINAQPRTVLGASGEVVHLHADDVALYQTLTRYTQELTEFLKNHSKRKQPSTRTPAGQGANQSAESSVSAAPVVHQYDKDEDMGF